MKFNRPDSLPPSLKPLLDNFGDELNVATVLDLTKKSIIFVEDSNHGGNRPLQHEFVDHGVHFIRPPDLKDGRIDFKNADHINETAFNRVRKGVGKAGDIILTHRATVGRIAITEEDDPPVFVTNPGTTVWRSVNDNILNQQYLYCYMRSPAFMDQLWANVGNNCTFDYVSLTQQRALFVAFPSIEQQKRIAGHLRSIDKKIQLNRQINQTLEGMAQAIFKSWFVDFEPVNAKIKAKANGQDPERAAMYAISGKTDDELNQLPHDQLAQLAATAALFPDELTESELSLIPKGWEVSAIGTEFEVTMGQSPPGHTYNEKNEGTPFFQGRRDFRWRYPVNRVYCTAPKRYAKKGDTLLSVRAPVGDVNKAMTDCCIGRGLSALRHKSGCEAYTYSTIKRLEQYFNNFDTEGTVFGSINQKDLKAIKIICPGSEVLKMFSGVAGIFDRQILNIENQASSLTQLRDTLLPKLLSGEINVSVAQSTIKEAV